MKVVRIVAALSVLLTVSVLQSYGAASDKGKDKGNGNGSGSGNKDSASNVGAVLAGVPAPELPAKAADLVEKAKQKDKEDVALAAISYVAGARPGSVAALVGSLSSVLPGSAPALTESAVKLLPSLAPDIAAAAIKSVPSLADQINKAAGIATPTPPSDPGSPKDNGHRPTIPPGQVNKDKPGSIRGNRPTIPPGHVRDPKPGRDHWRDYARP